MADPDSAREDAREDERQHDGQSAERRPRPRQREPDHEHAPRAAKRPVGKRPRPSEGGVAAGQPRPGDGSHRRMNGPRAAGLAAMFLADLTGKEFESIVGIRKSGDDWCIEVEVLEMRRIPSTTDVLAVYEVTVDADGELVGYERKARYVRGDAREDRE